MRCDRKAAHCASRAWLWLACLWLAGCVGFEPARLVPSIALSPEDISLERRAASGAAAGMDFGLVGTANESDSLFNVQTLPGVRIREVSPGGPAAMAGLQAGDIVLQVNGSEVNHPDELLALAAQTNASNPFAFQVRRGTTLLEASVMARPAAQSGAALRELYRTDPLATRAGYRTRVIEIAGRGETTTAEVVEISQGSPLADGDISIGDLVLALDGRPIGSAQGLIDQLLTEYDLGQTVSMTLYRDGTIFETRVQLWDPGRRINRISLRPLMFYESSLVEQQTRLSLLDFWIFSVYRFNRSEGERRHELFGIFSVSSDYGELVEETR